MSRRLLPAVVVMCLVALPACGSDDDGARDATTTTTAAAAADTTGTGDEAEPAGGELGGFVRSPLPDVADLTLPDVGDGDQPFAMEAAGDGILIVYFGYTSCPDVCPTTMADVRSTLQKLDDEADRVSVAMATIDPARDTPEILTSYVETFVPGGHALRTDDDASLRAVTDVFGADYGVTTADDGEIEVVHTGSLYAIDDEGRLRVTWPFGTRSDDMVRDLRILFSET
jgi:protein SCO1/2